MFWPVTSMARCAAARRVTAVLRLEKPLTPASQGPVDDERPGARDEVAAPLGVVPDGRRPDPLVHPGDRRLDGPHAGGHERPVRLGEGGELGGERQQRLAVLEEHALDLGGRQREEPRAPGGEQQVLALQPVHQALQQVALAPQDGGEVGQAHALLLGSAARNLSPARPPRPGEPVRQRGEPGAGRAPVRVLSRKPPRPRTEAVRVTVTTSDVEALVKDNLGLVGHLAREAAARLPRHLDADDLVGAGSLALVQAARAFDPELGVPFARFASTRIRGAMLDHMRQRDWATRSVRSRARSLATAAEELTKALHRQPTDAELAAAAGMSEQDVRAVLQVPDRARLVVTGYYLEDRQLTDIAEELGVTQSRASQLRSEGLDLLKEALSRLLEDDARAGHGASAEGDGVRARRRDAYVTAVARRSDVRRRADVSAYLDGAPVMGHAASSSRF